MAYGLFNPLDDLTQYHFENGRNPDPSQDTLKTFAQVLTDINNKGFNTCIIRADYNSYYQSLRYYAITAFNIPDNNVFYIANEEYLPESYYTDGIYFQDFGNVYSPDVDSYYYQNGNLTSTGVSYSLYQRCNLTSNKDNISYRGQNSSDQTAQQLSTILLSNANVDTWYFNNSPVISYEWTSVSSVNGKLGTINLSKLKDINDGEPVTGAGSSAVNLTDKSLINILVGNVIVDDNKVGVEYSVPSGTYEYIKLVYKQDSEPEDASDGTAIDLEIGDGVIGISGINDGNTYFFKIFTDINASQAYEFTTEKPVVPPEYQSYIDIINGSGFWWKNWPNKNYYNANQAGLAIYPPTLLSWISNYDDYSYNFTPTAARSQYCYVSNIQNVYITSNNNVYSVNHIISGSQQAFLYNNDPGWLGNVFTNQTFATMYMGQNPDGTTLSTSGTLAQVLSWMSYRFRNVNIYVDNVCWSKVN